MSMSEDPVQKPSRTEFDPLLTAAREIAEHAYAPYSRFRVGAAALTEDGRLVRGCNVENAGYGVTLCAECGLVSELIAGGGGRLRRFVCVGGDEHRGAGSRAPHPRRPAEHGRGAAAGLRTRRPPTLTHRGRPARPRPARPVRGRDPTSRSTP